MSEFKCPRCAADPRPENFGNDRQCAFKPDGSFNPENWNCATMNLLVDGAQNVIHGCDEQMEVRPVNRDDYGGWLITSRYKHRGCTSSAIIVGDFHPPEPLTFARAEAILSGEHLETWETHVEEPQQPVSGGTRIARDESAAQESSAPNSKTASSLGMYTWLASERAREQGEQPPPQCEQSLGMAGTRYRCALPDGHAGLHVHDPTITWSTPIRPENAKAPSARCAIPAPAPYACDQPAGHRGPCGQDRPGRKGLVW